MTSSSKPPKARARTRPASVKRDATHPETPTTPSKRGETRASTRELSGGHDPHRPVGHGNPPRRTQFKKGQSGNPRGRPKGSKDPRELIEQIINQRIEVRDRGRRRTVSIFEAILLRLRNQALEGDYRAIDRIFKLSPSGKHGSTQHPPSIDPNSDKEIIEEFARMLRELEPEDEVGLPEQDAEDNDDDS